MLAGLIFIKGEGKRGGVDGVWMEMRTARFGL